MLISRIPNNLTDVSYHFLRQHLQWAIILCCEKGERKYGSLTISETAPIKIPNRPNEFLNTILVSRNIVLKRKRQVAVPVSPKKTRCSKKNKTKLNLSYQRQSKSTRLVMVDGISTSSLFEM